MTTPVYTIAGVDRSGLILTNTFTLTDQLNSRTTAVVETFDAQGVYQPNVGESFTVTLGGVALFGGTVEAVEAAADHGFGSLHCVVDLVSYDQILDRHLVARTYDGWTAGAIVRDILAKDLAGEGVLGGNLLTADNASFETSSAGLGAPSLCTLGRSNAWAADGTWSITLTATSTSNMNIKVPIQPSLGGPNIPVTPGQTYTALASVSPATTQRNARINIVWFDAGYAQLSIATGPTFAEGPAGTETLLSIAAVAPVGAAYMVALPAILAPVAGELHYIDKVGLFSGVPAGWAIPSSIEDGSVVTHAVFAYLTAAAALDQLSQLIGFSWWVDANKVLHFQNRISIAAPWAVADTSGNWRTMKAKKTRSTYRNRQYIFAGTAVSATRTEQFNGDGATQTFTVGFPFASAPAVSLIGEGLQQAVVQCLSGTPASQWSYRGFALGYTQSVGGLGITGDIYTIQNTQAGPITMQPILQTAMAAGVAIPGNPYTVAFWLQSSVSGGRLVTPQIVFVDASGAILSTVNGTAANDTTATYTKFSASATAPANTAGVLAAFTVDSVGSGESHYLARVSIQGTWAQTVGVKQVDTGKDWYYQVGSPGLTQDSSLSAPQVATVNNPTDELVVTYQGQFPLAVVIDETVEMASRAAVEGGTGIYEAAEQDTTVNTQQLATDRANGLLRRYGHIPTTITFETDRDGLMSGQLLSLSNTRLGLNSTYLIDKVTAQDMSGQFLRYGVECLDGEVLGGWVQFFQALVDQGTALVIAPNTVLASIIAPSDTLTFTDALTPVQAAYTAALVDLAQTGFSEVA